MKIYRILSCIILLLTTGVLQAQTTYYEPETAKIGVKTYTYAQKEGLALKFDFYESERLKDSIKPLFIFVHGGGFAGGRRDEPEIKMLARMAVNKGYAAASISYRLTRKGKGFGCNCPATAKRTTFKKASEDLLDAIALMIDHKKIAINPEKIILAGSSAGAETVLNTAYNAPLFAKQHPLYGKFKPAAVISLAGAVVDIRYITADTAIPGIFFHGTADSLVPYASAAHHYCTPDKVGYLMLDGSAAIVQKLKTFNQSFLFYSFKDAGHDIFKIPFKKMESVFSFIDNVVLKKQKQQSIIYE